MAVSSEIVFNSDLIGSSLVVLAELVSYELLAVVPSVGISVTDLRKVAGVDETTVDSSGATVAGLVIGSRVEEVHVTVGVAEVSVWLKDTVVAADVPESVLARNFGTATVVAVDLREVSHVVGISVV